MGLLVCLKNISVCFFFFKMNTHRHINRQGQGRKTERLTESVDFIVCVLYMHFEKLAKLKETFMGELCDVCRSGKKQLEKECQIIGKM